MADQFNQSKKIQETSHQPGRFLLLVMLEDDFDAIGLTNALGQILHRKDRKAIILPVGKYAVIPTEDNKTFSELLYRLKSINYKDTLGIDEFITTGDMVDFIQPFASIRDFYELTPADIVKLLRMIVNELAYDDYLLILNYQQVIGVLKDYSQNMVDCIESVVYVTGSTGNLPQVEAKISLVTTSLTTEDKTVDSHLINLGGDLISEVIPGVSRVVNLQKLPTSLNQDLINRLSYHEGLIRLIGIDDVISQHTLPPRSELPKPLVRENYSPYRREDSLPFLQDDLLFPETDEQKGKQSRVRKKKLAVKSNAESDKMSFFYLLSHYSKENKEKYLRSRENYKTVENRGEIGEKRAYLFRVATSEKVLIKGVVFHIGKSRRTAHYIVLNNPAISRMHAYIIHKGSTYYLADNNSTNRTALNGKLLDPYIEVELKHGDQIQLADETFQFMNSDTK